MPLNTDSIYDENWFDEHHYTRSGKVTLYQEDVVTEVKPERNWRVLKGRKELWSN